MKKQEALAILRIKDGEPVEIEKSFQRMARRYPPESFPERFSKIRAAYDLLRNPFSEVTEALRRERADLSFLHGDGSVGTPEVELDEPSSMKVSISEMLRGHLVDDI